MFSFNSRIILNSCVLSLGGLILLQFLVPKSVYSQVYLNNNNSRMTRSKASLDMGDGIRCSSDGGSVPTLSMSVGALPDRLYDDDIVYNDFNRNGPSSLSAMVSVNVPLLQTSQDFRCNELFEQVLVRSKIENLREMYEEGILTDRQFQSMSLKLNEKLFTSAEFKDVKESLNHSNVSSQGQFALSLRDESPAVDDHLVDESPAVDQPENNLNPTFVNHTKQPDLLSQETLNSNFHNVKVSHPHIQPLPPLPSSSEPIDKEQYLQNIAYQ